MKFFAYAYADGVVNVQRYRDVGQLERVANYPETRSITGPFDASNSDDARRKARRMIPNHQQKTEEQQ